MCRGSFRARAASASAVGDAEQRRLARWRPDHERRRWTVERFKRGQNSTLKDILLVRTEVVECHRQCRAETAPTSARELAAGPYLRPRTRPLGRSAAASSIDTARILVRDAPLTRGERRSTTFLKSASVKGLSKHGFDTLSRKRRARSVNAAPVMKIIRSLSSGCP